MRSVSGSMSQERYSIILSSATGNTEKLAEALRQAQPDHPANLDALIENFDRALSHPDAADLNNLRKLVLA